MGREEAADRDKTVLLRREDGLAVQPGDRADNLAEWLLGVAGLTRLDEERSPAAIRERALTPSAREPTPERTVPSLVG